jgi:hypothetical protein
VRMLLNLLLDPRVFNFVILGLYGINVVNYLIRREWNSAWYWASAASITASVTFIIGKGVH